MADELTTSILIEIRDEMREMKADGRETNQRLAILAKITQGIDTRLSKMEAQHVFLPRRVDVLEQKVASLEQRLGDED